MGFDDAELELGGVILAQQINPLTQKTPIEGAEHCLSNYRGSLQKWEAVHDGGMGPSVALIASPNWARCWMVFQLPIWRTKAQAFPRC